MHSEKNPWSVADKQRLAVLYRVAVAQRDLKPRGRFSRPPEIEWASIAAALGRTIPSIIAEVSRSGMHRVESRLRKCIGPICRGEREFWSEGVHNRLCTRCQATAERAA